MKQLLCFALCAATLTACSRQVCQCAVHVGGITPADARESEMRQQSVERCLERHGGGTIHGCPMPPSAE